MRARTVLTLVLVVALVGAALGAFVWSRWDTDDAPRATGEKAPAGLEPFYSQELEWEDCDDQRCAWVEVPVDYEEPEGETTRLRMVVHESTGDGGRALFVNPGGPGGSAIDFAGTMASTFPDDVTDEFSIVGVDPRGVGRSTPIDCLSDEDFDAFVASDPSPDDAAEVEEFREGGRQLGAGCAKKSGALAGHVSTEEAARDMDVVRALLGQEKMDWFGASYGTQLGAVYATLFPEKVGAMVLDGAVDPSQDVIESSLGQATGFQRAVEAYVADCVKLESCPLGNDADAAVDRLADLLASLDEEPLPSGSDREVTEGLAFYGVAVTLYDKATWPVLSQALTRAVRGDGSVLLQLADAYFQRTGDGSFNGNIGEVIYAVNCADARETPSLEETRAALPRFEEASPVFGRGLGWGVITCTDWPIDRPNPLPEVDATGASPIVVVGTTRDPATPYENARALADQLGDDVGVLLTREGDGHTAYTSGNDCITKVVDAYLVDGTAPEDGTTCEE